METNIITRNIMNLRGFSNASLAKKLGKSTPSAVSNAVYRGNAIKVETLIEMMDAMDCEIVIRSNLKDRTEWIVTK